MIEPPGPIRAQKTPTIEARIEIPPSASGYR